MTKGPNTNAYLQQLKMVTNLDGDMAECGVYQGRNTYYYAQLLSEKSPEKFLYAFDTFGGLPKDAEDGVDLCRFDDVRFNEVKQYLEVFKNIDLCQGLFEDTFDKVKNKRFCCVVIDCDLYESYKTTLKFFYPILVPGGVFILDEYYSKKYPLARVAVDEFCESIKEKPERFHIEDNGWERWRIVKQ